MPTISTIELIWHAGVFVKFVLLMLLGFSLVCWAIILHKCSRLRAANRQSAPLRQLLDQGALVAAVEAAERLPDSPLAALCRALPARNAGQSRESIRLVLARTQTRELEQLRTYMTFLATTGSATPFIGLLGTVWGIMDAFRGIGATGSASLAVVAPGIAEALITTAMGLAAAIPAVIAYNYFASRVRRLAVEMEQLSEELAGAYAPGHKPA